MAAPFPLRSDFDAALLRRLARQSHDPDQTRRLLALAEIYEGGSRSGDGRIGGVGMLIVRDWVLRFNAEGFGAFVNRIAPGAPSLLNDHQRKGLRQVAEDGPIIKRASARTYLCASRSPSWKAEPLCGGK